MGFIHGALKCPLCSYGVVTVVQQCETLNSAFGNIKASHKASCRFKPIWTFSIHWYNTNGCNFYLSKIWNFVKRKSWETCNIECYMGHIEYWWSYWVLMIWILCYVFLIMFHLDYGILEFQILDDGSRPEFFWILKQEVFKWYMLLCTCSDLSFPSFLELV